ncbi:MAG: glycine cleavage system protein T [Desulfurococcales archaeon ex4484_58]|nr:MAG: glycine cleavage system protein T [Desulfurococcales archaeon ex4484_58]
MNKIPLLDFYIEELGGEPGSFGDWEVPMRFTSSLEEHLNVRSGVGVFDVSHMGRIKFTGSDVFDFIQYVYTKDLSKIRDYWMSGPTLALNSYARIKDDEMLYRLGDHEWLVVVNANAREKMLRYFREIIDMKKFKVEIEDLTFKYSMIALQGPRSPEILEKLGGREFADLKPLEFRVNVDLGELRIFLISRSGWTGEDGFEIWGEHSVIKELVKRMVSMGVKPAGLIARDTLRMEMGFVLGDHEYGEDPLKYPCALSLRYGMGAITWSKHGFVGEEALRGCRREGVRWIRVGLKMSKKAGRIVPRQNDRVYVDDLMIGWVTSGSFSPVLKRGIAQAYIDVRYALFGEPVDVVIRGKRYEAKIVDFPFIKR